MVTKVKKAAEDVSSSPYGTGGQGALFGATKETMRQAVAAQKAITGAAQAAPGVFTEAAGTQAGAATSAGEKLGDAYAGAGKGIGGAYTGAAGQMGSAYGAASDRLKGAYLGARGAMESKHTNALMDARRSLAQAAMRGMQRGRTTAGNLGAAGTLGKQAAVTHGQLASQQATDLAQLGVGEAAALNQLGLGKAQALSDLGLARAGKLGELGIAGTQAQTAAQQAAAGYTATGMKEAAAAEIAAAEAYKAEVMTMAEAQGAEYAMTEGQAQEAQTRRDEGLAAIDAAAMDSWENGIIAGAAILDDFDVPMTPEQRVNFTSFFAQSMLNSGAPAGSGMWTSDQAYGLAESLGAGEALRQMSYIEGWLGDKLSVAPSPAAYKMAIDRMVATGMTLDQLPDPIWVSADNGGGMQMVFEDEVPDGYSPIVYG